MTDSPEPSPATPCDLVIGDEDWPGAHFCRTHQTAHASPATPRPEGHTEGDNHNYEARCTVCGEVGYVRVSVVPERFARLSDTGERPTPDLSSAAGQPLNPDQAQPWPDHAAMSCDER